MFDILAVTTTAVPHAAEGSNMIGQIAGQFGVEWKLLVAQIINFALVAYLLYRFAFKPVLQTMDARQKRIAEGLQFSEEMEQKLRDAEKEYADKMQQAAAEAKSIIDQARDNAKEFSEQQTQEAIAKAEGILTKAQESIELEKRQMLSEVRKEVATLVVDTTGKVLNKDLTADDRSRFSQSAVQELGLN